MNPTNDTFNVTAVAEFEPTGSSTMKLHSANKYLESLMSTSALESVTPIKKLPP